MNEIIENNNNSMIEMKILDNIEFGEIRTLINENGKMMFLGNDVATALGYKRPQDAINQHCIDEDSVFYRVLDSAGKNQKTKFINEGNVYRLIVKSKLDSARQFEKWVFDDVLPSLRKNGMYAKSEILDNPEFLMEVVAKLKAEKDEKETIQRMNIRLIDEKYMLTEENTSLYKKIEDDKPKLSYYDDIIESKLSMTVTQIGLDYGMSAIALNRILEEERIQRKVNNQWTLYAKYNKKGLIETRTMKVNNNKTDEVKVVIHTQWTQKGRLLIHNVLSNRGIDPIKKLNKVGDANEI